MSANARKTYEDAYTPDKNLELLMNIYRNVLEKTSML